MCQFSSLHATDVFLRLTKEKQQKIFDSAAAEFASHGFDSANTNLIAKRAGISVGSLFQYFRTKQDLFLALVDYGIQTLLAPVIDDMREAQDVLALFRQMLYKSRDFANNYPHYNQIYLSLTAQMPSHMTTALARRIEERTIASYLRAMRRVQEGNDAGVREGCIAFMLDDLVLSFQFSFASPYYRERLIAYTGLDPQTNGDELIEVLCLLMKDLLSCSAC